MPPNIAIYAPVVVTLFVVVGVWFLRSPLTRCPFAFAPERATVSESPRFMARPATRVVMPIFARVAIASHRLRRQDSHGTKGGRLAYDPRLGAWRSVWFHPAGLIHENAFSRIS